MVRRKGQEGGTLVTTGSRLKVRPRSSGRLGSLTGRPVSAGGKTSDLDRLVRCEVQVCAGKDPFELEND